MMETELKPLLKLRNQIKYDGTNIPSFINARLPLHREIWGELQTAIHSIGKLAVNRILKPVTIISVIAEVKMSMANICEVCDDEFMEIECSAFIFSRLNEYMEYTLTEELYEVAINLREFNKWGEEEL